MYQKVARFGDWESSSKRNLSCDLSTRGSMSCKSTRYYERNFSWSPGFSSHHHFSPVHLPEIIDWEYTLRLLLASGKCSRLRPFTETYDQTVQGNTLLTRDETEAVSLPHFETFQNSPERTGDSGIGLGSKSGTCRETLSENARKMAVSQAVWKLPLLEVKYWHWPIVSIVKSRDSWTNVGVCWRSSWHCRGTHTYKTPFVSGNVSLYNASASGSVSPSANIGALGKICCGILLEKTHFKEEVKFSYSENDLLLLVVQKLLDFWKTKWEIPSRVWSERGKNSRIPYPSRKECFPQELLRKVVLITDATTKCGRSQKEFIFQKEFSFEWMK